MWLFMRRFSWPTRPADDCIDDGRLLCTWVDFLVWGRSETINHMRRSSKKVCLPFINEHGNENNNQNEYNEESTHDA